MYSCYHLQKTCNTGSKTPSTHSELQRDIFQVVSMRQAERQRGKTKGCRSLWTGTITLWKKKTWERSQYKHILRHWPSVSVALLMTFVSFAFRLVYVTLVFPSLSYRPVPSDIRHCNGTSGQRHLHSWTANAEGLFSSRPPSCKLEINTNVSIL